MANSPLKTMRIKALDALVLIKALQDANLDPNLAKADADKTFEELVKALNKSIQIDKKVLESALWACGMLEEKGKFWNPKGWTFKQFVAQMWRGERSDYFDIKYNLILEKPKSAKNDNR